MSPVSRGRKPKKHKSGPKKTAQEGGGTQRLAPGQPSWMQETPHWFSPAITKLLDNLDPVLEASGPRELEQSTAELLGASMYHSEGDEGAHFWFTWWAYELARAAAQRVSATVGDGESAGWHGSLRLLYGMVSLVPVSLLPGVRSELNRASKSARKHPAIRAELADWLSLMPKCAPTGQLWRMLDAYGDRFGVLASVRYPGWETSIYSFDIDGSAFDRLAGAGEFDTVEEAAAAWRSSVGESATDAEISTVTSSADVECLAHWYPRGPFAEILTGHESRLVFDNLFRARRRFEDLERVLAKRGTPLAAATREQEDTSAVCDAFGEWFDSRYGKLPSGEAVDALAWEWFAIAMPGTEHAASPERARTMRALVDDWVQDEITAAASALLPEWTRWHAERSGVSGELVARTVAAADQGSSSAR